jgi:transcriptional regulator with XRE-family HTH domain
MARRKSKPPRQLSHHWYLAEWAERLGVRQKDAVNKLGWSKAQASDLFTGKQRYTQDLIDEVAAWLHLAPYELLMAPADAYAIREMRESAARLAGPVAFTPPAAKVG